MDEQKYEEGRINFKKLNYYKFLSNNNAYKSQRQIEIIRNFSFIDIINETEIT